MHPFCQLNVIHRAAGVPAAQFCVTFAEMRNLELEFEGKMSLGDLKGFQKLIARDWGREGTLICWNGKDGQYHVIRREGRSGDKNWCSSRSEQAHQAVNTLPHSELTSHRHIQSLRGKLVVVNLTGESLSPCCLSTLFSVCHVPIVGLSGGVPLPPQPLSCPPDFPPSFFLFTLHLPLLFLYLAFGWESSN